MNTKKIIETLKTIKDKKQANDYIIKVSKKYPDLKMSIYQWFEINNYLYSF